MSDNINEANNICVPEDAFEKFQADNVCEEDDFITLADIMPSQPPTQDVIVDLDEIQDDISIVDEPEQQIHDGNITKLSSSSTNPDHEIHSDTTSTVDDVQFVPNERLQPTSVTPSAENEEKDEINRNISLSQTNSDEHCFSCVSEKVSVDQNPSSMVTSLRAPKRAQKRRSSLEFSFDGESNESLVFNESSQCRKRGRPKRTDTINCQLQSSLDMNDTLKKKTGRHRKQKNSSHNESEDSQIVTNFSNSEKVCDTSSTDDKSLNQTVEESVKPTTQSAKEINSSESLAVSSEEKELNNSLESASNSVIVTSSKKPRRPRQKKSFYTYEPIYPSEDQNSSQKPEGHARESSSQVKDTPETVTKPAAKRGRAKSMANNDQRINHFDHDYVHASNQSTEGDLGKKKGKRGRQTKSNCELTTSSKSDGTNDAKDQEAVEKIYDEVELELIRILSTPTNDLEENIEKKQAKNNQNPPKRRGRKPKKQPSVDNNTEQSQDKKEILPDDDADDICLSSLKKQLKPSEECPKDEKNVIGEEANEVILKDNDINKTEKVDDTPLNNQNLSQPSSIVTDQNTDNINNLATIVDENVTNDNESESSSKRPVRRKAKKILHYDEGSDEDPFANVELSDDDLSGRKAGRYYSDDEYIPGKRKKGNSFVRTSSSEEESEDLDKEDELIFKKQERKKRGKKTDESPKKSPHKKRRQSNVNHDAVPDITSTAADTTTQIDEQVPQSPDAFDNIIVKKILGGNIQIKKVSAATPIQSTLEIPILDPNEPKKIVEVFTQTTKAKTKSVEVQTTAPYEGTMKNKVPLTLQQSEKACQFLQGIVKTTSDLGQLMIQKSEDFIQKKINTENITDTTKLDYCVKKSFLLFKLARHNLVQMEEDLANEYEQFLQSNNMSQYRDVPKSMSATPKQSNSDSDCEIIEEPVMQKEKEKPKFNLKTVFLNKELSIKMAKPQKSFEQPLTKKNLTEKVNVQGRHTVWINDSIMVKKVKPTHSFLAQDSRNKKPPDSCITVEAVKQFFDNYYKKQQVLKTCAPFISPEWMNVRQPVVCYYFIDQINDLSSHSPVLLSAQAEAESSGNASNNKLIVNCQSQPLKLKTLCFKVLQKCMFATRIHDYLNVDDKYNSYDKTHYQPATLFGLSFNVISKLLTEDNKAHQKVSKNISITRDISSLQIMCLNRINNLFFNPLCTNVDKNVPQKIITVKEIHKHKSAGMNSLLSPKQPLKRNFKTLFSLCFDMLQKTELCLRNVNNYDIKENNIIFTAIKPLKCLAYEAIKLNLYNDTDEDKIVDIILEQPELSFPAVQSVDETDDTITLTIESVNTLSDDIFSNIPETAVDVEPPILENDDSNFSNYDEFEHEYEESNDDNNLPEESNWVSKVQLQELKSCFLSVDDNVSKPQVSADDSNKEYAIAQIKIEPMEEITENEVTPVIKREPVESVDDIVNFTPLITKLENTENLEENEGIPDKNNHSYDEDAFESFARTSKMLHAATDYSLSNEEIFSQSALRVRRQHEPDFDDDIDTSMSLLVPQDNIEQAKDRLMESSSDDENVGQKNAAKKKRRGRPKGTKGKVKDVVFNKDKQTVNNEVALLTKKMQDKIRQEEKKDESSDSELENSLALRRENSKKTVDKTKSKTSNQIQCNDVDSTENLNDSTKNNLNKEENKKKLARTSLRNKSKEDQLEESNESKDQGESFVMQADEPVELLECEPTLPMMHDDVETVDKECPIDQETVPAQIKEPEPEEPEQTYIERHGWKCFPVNTDDTKLYENTYILLEKLPESFVETYFRYQGMTDKDQDDTDVERLTNLQSLHRNVSRESKWKSKSRTANGHLKKKEKDSSSRPSSPANNEDCVEFSPSEDEEANIDDETAPPAPHQDAVENAMAKDWLMNDGERDSDSEKPSKNVEKTSEDGEKVKIKKEVTDEPSDKPRRRPGPKSRCKEIKEIDSLMLTADKMMNKELALLHAPVSLNVENQDVKDVQKKPSTKNKSTSKHKEHLERTKNEEDSSSEEEKQWVNTKEKLLKRLEKKQGNPSVDDAKRAKIVSEFIERRGEAPEKRPRGRGRSRRSGKKFLERQKQMSVLNKELFGEVDTTLTGRKHSNALGKGRKNIRKVIDKKSLARSTVIANMEEFERKRRLNMQQTRLREELGCEEGVNVLVINDEVCLEYDFEEMRPVVTVHPFFTRVMKAHQYEGVKFMWDACFESIAMVESGHPGGGCILAHCMGLGKTLQVLALLHTVLTHPRVRMHRILVCCPLSTVLNWVDEIHKWIGPVTNQIKVFELSKLKKTYERAYQLEDWYNGGGIFIIGYELFRSLTTLDAVLDDIRPTIVNKIRMALLDPGPDVVICDEGHLLKNDSSVLAVAMSRVATKRRIVLTGTPMQNNLREYYCMVNFVKPSLLGTYSEYSNRFENPIMNGQHRDSQEEDIKLMKARTHILHKVLEGCLQRQEASVLYPYLPKKHEYTVFIPPTKCQWDLYKHYIMTYAMHQQQQQNNVEKQKKQHSVLKDFHVLQKIWTHPQVLHNFLMKGRDERNKIKMEKLEDDLAQEDLAASEDVKPNQTEVWWLQYLEGGGMLDSLESSNKFMVVFQLLEECIALGDKVLIFSTSLYTMDALEYFLKHINKWSLGQEYYRLDGSVPAEVRQKWCREFNAEHNLNTKLFLISTRAGSLGLNMTAANRVIILDTSWNPAHDIQSIFRVYRFGQKKDCYIYRLVAMGTMEQKIYERSVTKQAVACRVVDEQQIDRHYNMSELTELYRFDEEGTSVEAGLAAGVADVALLRVAARARLHAVREHDSLLRGSREQHLPEHERAAAWMQFQQEHANEEMQDRLMEASRGIQHMLAPQLAMQSGLMPIKTENGMQLQVPIPVPPPPPSQGKKKRGRKPPNSIPPSPENIVQMAQAVTEDAKVKMIMKLLIKHNFLDTKPASEVSQLVSNVRRIVDNKGVGLEDCDELTRSIATVMLEEEEPKQPITPPPALTDIITGDLDSTPHQPEIKQEVPEVENQFEVPNETSLLVPVREEVRRQRGRPRKYSVQDKPKPLVQRGRGRPRKRMVSDSEDDSKGVQSSSSSSSGITSRRTRNSHRNSYVSDVEEVLSRPESCYTSKESSPIPFDERIDNPEAPIEKSIEKAKEKPTTRPRPKRQISSYSEQSDVSLIDYNSNPPPSKEDQSVVLDDSGNSDSEERNSRSRKGKIAPPVEVVPEPESTSTGKTKRKAALAAKQHLESLNGDDIVTLDDDDDEWVADSVDLSASKPASETSKDKSETARADTKYKKSYEKRIENSKTEKNKANPPKEPPKNQNYLSILLSDDEDVQAVETDPKPSPQAQDISTSETKEEISLHPSMLSNVNFIKIVAYAYQSNRMLDEDAALLAAQYSTQKALKEIETTGKSITSGPLYDIAVKVLGTDVLKKLHDKKDKGKVKKTSEVDAPSLSISVKQNEIKNEPVKSKTERPKITIKSENLIKPLNFNEKQKKSDPASNTTSNKNTNCGPAMHVLKNKEKPKSPNPEVVPVGMFKGIVPMNQKSDEVEECILPDDDDVIFHRSTNANPPVSQPPPTSVYKKPNAQPFVITSVSSSKRPEPIPMPTPPRADITTPEVQQSNIAPQQPVYLTISNGKLVIPANVTKEVAPSVVPGAAPVQQPPANDTICLDSDEEEVTDVPPPPPLQSIPLGPLPAKPPVSNQTFQPVPLVPVHQSPLQPSPVALSTSVPGANPQIIQMPVLTDVQGMPVMFRLDDAPGIVPNIDQTQQQGFIIIDPATGNLMTPDVPNPPNPPMLPTPAIPMPAPAPKVAQVTENKDVGPGTKKVCKPGDIVRITKEGSLEVLSRVDRLPSNVKAQSISSKVENRPEPKLQPPVPEKRKTTVITPVLKTRPNATFTSKDPLSILKDVVQIRAFDEPIAKTSSKIEAKPAPKQTKYVAIAPKYDSKVANKSNDNMSRVKPGDYSNLNKYKATVVQYKNDKNSSNNSSMQGNKKVISASPKDIIIRTKPSGSSLVKASASTSNVRPANVKTYTTQYKDLKKRASPWPDTSSVKKKKVNGVSRPMTLKDFNIDDIDDIIELE